MRVRSGHSSPRSRTAQRLDRHQHPGLRAAHRGGALATVALLSLTAAGSAHAQAASSPLEARVAGGLVRGALEHGVVAFKGIPFAAPPVGTLRWAPPQPVKPWKGVRPALRFGADCMQLPTPGDMAPLRTEPGEDCLYVNVWRPRRAPAHALPVMVWIYGGGFVDGGTSPAVYDGTQFARDGVVLVSFNYRVGNFGFFAFPALAREAQNGPLANYAFMDQIAALKWVRRNIAAFGGDPRNVTIFGESAGGMSVNALIGTPLAHGLFERAIVESGGGRPLPQVMRDRPLAASQDSAEAMGIRLARHFGIEGEGARALEALRALPAATLVDGLNMATMAGDHTYAGGPVIDGRLYLGPATQVYAAGAGARLPVMIGANSADLGGDRWMIEPARAIARLLAARGQRVYEYRFSYVASSMRHVYTAGAPHATEIPFVFDTVRAHYGAGASRADEVMARAMHAYWVAFARSGRPDPKDLPAWPAYHPRSDRLMNFTRHGPVPEADPWRRRLDTAERAAERAEAASRHSP